MKTVSVLGCTGSIGRQALDILQRNLDAFGLFAVSAQKDSQALFDLTEEFRPRVVATKERVADMRRQPGIIYLDGPDAACKAAAMDEADVVVHGISGIAALEPLLSALEKGKRVALANKESIVCGNALVQGLLEQGKGELIPVDSEQSAIFQCLAAGRKADVKRLILTASGGPFWQAPLRELESITPEQALRHPTWSMGRKITVDSATLFNKGLEIMEAAGLFGMGGKRITVLIHPQSIVHSAVEFVDSSVMVNAANPDMRLAIQYALTYPERIPSPVKPLGLNDLAGLSFFPADMERFRPLALSYEALKAGGTAPTVYNGANERAVALFLEGRLGFLGITRAVEYALDAVANTAPDTLNAIWAADAQARRAVERYAQTHLR